MGSDEERGDGIQHLFKLNPSKLQKVTKYSLVYSSVFVTLISEFSNIATYREPSILDR